MRTTGNVVVVTGGGSGIGLALSAALIARGNTVVALGRSAQKLERARAEVPGLLTAVCDVSDEQGTRRALAEIAAAHRGFQVLVNAAGTSRACRFAEDPQALELARAEIGTNLLGTVVATKLALEHLLREKEAAVVTISSGIALAPHLAEPTHSATKAALHAFCLCLRAQLAGTSVKVFEVQPPLTETALTEKVAGKKVSPQEVAEAVVRGMERDRFEIRVGIVKLLGILSRLSPSLAAKVVTGSAK